MKGPKSFAKKKKKGFKDCLTIKEACTNKAKGEL